MANTPIPANMPATSPTLSAATVTITACASDPSDMPGFKETLIALGKLLVVVGEIFVYSLAMLALLTLIIYLVRVCGNFDKERDKCSSKVEDTVKGMAETLRQIAEECPSKISSFGKTIGSQFVNASRGVTSSFEKLRGKRSWNFEPMKEVMYEQDEFEQLESEDED